MGAASIFAFYFKRMIFDHIMPFTSLENLVKEGSVKSVLLGRHMMLCYLKSSNIKYGIAGLMHEPREVYDHIRLFDKDVSINLMAPNEE